MKIIPFKALLASLFMGVSLIGSAQQTRTFNDTLMLSLDKCIMIALSDNPTIKVADMEIERTDYYNKEILGQLLPNISFSAQYSRTLAKQTMYLNMDALSGGSATGGTTGGMPETDAEEIIAESRASSSKSDGGIKMGLDNTYTVGFSASMPLVAPQLWKTLKLSDTQILQTVEAARQSRLSMVNQVKKAYYALLLAEDSYKVILESYENAKVTNDIYTKKHKLGAASEFDVLRTSVAVKNIEPQLMQSEVTIKQAHLQLCLLMGMDTRVPFKPTTTLSEYENTMYESTLSIDKSIDNNSDLKMLDIQTQMLDDALQIQRMAWYPTLALSANCNWTSMSDGNPFANFRWSPNSAIALSLSFPIVQGGQRYNRIKQAEVQYNEMKYQRENLERAINMQVELAVDNIHINVKQISTCAENVKQAERAREIMEKSFKLGAATYLDLRDSQLSLTNTRLTYLQAIYNYLIATSELELLLGNADVEGYNAE